MPHKSVSRDLSTQQDNNLSKWDMAIAEAKQRISTLKRSIKTLEALRDSGMEMPTPKPKRRGRKARQRKAETQPPYESETPLDS